MELLRPSCASGYVSGVSYFLAIGWAEQDLTTFWYQHDACRTQIAAIPAWHCQHEGRKTWLPGLLFFYLLFSTDKLLCTMWVINIRRQASWCAIGMVDKSRLGEKRTWNRSFKCSWGLIQKTLAYIDTDCEKRPEWTEIEEAKGKNRRNLTCLMWAIWDSGISSFFRLRKTFVTLLTITDAELIQLPANPIRLAFRKCILQDQVRGPKMHTHPSRGSNCCTPVNAWREKNR